MGERYYDPALGRFTQRDPQPHLGDPAQQSAYTYAADDPVNLMDPNGTDCSVENERNNAIFVVAAATALLVALRNFESHPSGETFALVVIADLYFQATYDALVRSFLECVKPGSPPPQIPPKSAFA